MHFARFVWNEASSCLMTVCSSSPSAASSPAKQVPQGQYNRASLGVQSILSTWQSITGTNDTTLASVTSGPPDLLARLRVAPTSGEAAESGWLPDRFEQFSLSRRSLFLASEALVRKDLDTFGKLVDESQAAAENLLGNQVPETIWLAREARAIGAYAASAFGAGFGGSVWALVSVSEAADFANRWREAYERSSHGGARSSQFFVTTAGPPLTRI